MMKSFAPPPPARHSLKAITFRGQLLPEGVEWCNIVEDSSGNSQVYWRTSAGEVHYMPAVEETDAILVAMRLSV